MKKISGVKVAIITVVVAIAAVLISELLNPGRAQLTEVLAKILAWVFYVLAPAGLTVVTLIVLSDAEMLGNFSKMMIWLCVLVVLTYLYPLGGAALDKWVFHQEVTLTLPWTLYVIAEHSAITFTAKVGPKIL